MFNLSSVFQYYMYDLPEYRKLIKEEKAKIDPTAIISIDEFIEKIMMPVLEDDHEFGRLFVEYLGAIENTLYHWTTFDHIESFNIDLDMMDEDTQALMSDRVEGTLSGEKSTSEALLTEIRDTLARRKGVILDEGVDQLSDVVENRKYPTLYLGIVLRAIDSAVKKHTDQDDALHFAERHTLWTGNGSVALSFWKEVNSLKDYSGFFPHKPKPKGNNKDDNFSKRPVRDWISGVLTPGTSAQPT